ncbi:DUF2273 domain-containing protein [Paenibacillus xylaniclasticus]|uniref:DUF2273 domain-containing protein n=1 Tax=Paenibacillus xylaniclasticus TaxID=588083 RepID=UPI000FDAEE50|nr:MULTISPECIES: DUF2273 domain-containing protein [Paenibacillus]GFN30547.1 hypothetical protein PCURB6_08070 [Paenibacillus curdlanolyticus]
MWKHWLSDYGGRIAGAAVGLVLGIVYLFAGFWDMLVFAFLIGVGYVIGKRMESGEGLRLPFNRVAKWMERWIGRQRPFR